MKVCVGIVTRGRAELAEKAVESALMQEPPPELVWVIEDGVVGKPFEWEKGGPVRITRWEKNQGYLAARIKMTQEAEGELFVSLDDDAWFLELDAIAHVLEVMKKDPKVGAVAFDILSPDRPQSQPRGTACEARMFIGCGHALRLSAVRAVGGYEQMPGLYGGEEKDLCLRLKDEGWRVVKLPGVHVWHDKTPTQRDLTAQRRAGVLNDLTLIWRRCPRWKVAFYLLGNSISQIRFSMGKPRERLGPTLQGIGEFLLAWPRLWASRRAVSAKTWKLYRRSG